MHRTQNYYLIARCIQPKSIEWYINIMHSFLRIILDRMLLLFIKVD